MNGYCVLALVAALITLGVSRIARQIIFHPFQTGYNAIKDLYYYQLHRGWHNCPVGALDIYCGYFGSGKTLSLVHKVVGLYNHYKGVPLLRSDLSSRFAGSRARRAALRTAVRILTPCPGVRILRTVCRACSPKRGPIF